MWSLTVKLLSKYQQTVKKYVRRSSSLIEIKDVLYNKYFPYWHLATSAEIITEEELENLREQTSCLLFADVPFSNLTNDQSTWFALQVWMNLGCALFIRVV